MLLVHPAGSEHHDSSAVMKVPHGVQNDGSKATCSPGFRLCQIVSVLPVAISWRWTPDWPVSNTVNVNWPRCGPVWLTVFMSQLPLLGAPAASWVLRSATERCWKAGLPNVIGCDSSAVGPAEAVSGVKSEKRTGLAPAGSGITATPAMSRPLIVMAA